MPQRRNEPTWPLLCILICLFVLSATSPSIWERAAKNKGRHNASVDPQLREVSRNAPTPAPRPAGSVGEPAKESRSFAPVTAKQEASVVSAGDVGSAAAFRPAPVAVPFGNRVTLAAPTPSGPRVGDADPPVSARSETPPRTPAVIDSSHRPFVVNRSDGRPTETPAAPEAAIAKPSRDEPPQAAPSTGDWRPSLALAGHVKSTPRIESLDAIKALLLPTEPLGAGLQDEAVPTASAKPAHSADKPVASIDPPASPEPKPTTSAAKPTPAVDKPVTSSDKPATDGSKPAPAEPSASAVATDNASKPLAPDAVPRANPAQADEKWPKPESLFAQLTDLARTPETRDWATSVETAVRALGPAMRDGTPEALPLAAKLEQLSERGSQLAGELGNRPTVPALRRAIYALDRRLSIWKPIVRAGGLKAGLPKAEDADLSQFEPCLESVNALLEESSEGPGWRRFLAIDSLRGVVSDRTAVANGRAADLARKILDRISQTPMKAQQRRFLTQAPLAALLRNLRQLASTPVPFEDVLRHVEQFEQDGAPYEARILAGDCQRLVYCKAGQSQAIGQGIEEYYRNANLRLVVTAELLNRFIPERAKQYGDVTDVVGGNHVYGRSLTSTRVGLRLIPDSHQIHVALDVNGYVAASTHSVSGPATFYNDSESVYRGWKEIEIGPDGLVIHPAQVGVNNDLTLRGLSTDFDELPLIGALAQEVARSQHEQKRCEMSSEVEQKVAAKARSQIDDEAETRLGTAAQRVRAAVLDPLCELSLGPTLVSAETSDRRVTTRLRVASDGQLGGYTPRPQAPADSALSFQIHESVLNNVFEQLGLDGKTFTLPQLRQRIAGRLMREDLFRGGTENDDVTISFAPHNAVHVACREGKVILRLAMARLVKPPYAWDDFQVRVLLRPRVQGRMVQLMREDVVQLTGSRLNTRSQIGLRAVFGKTFPKERPIMAVPERVLNEPRLQDLVFTQLVVEDGWIGAALGAGRVARQSSPSDQPQTRTK